MSGMLKSEWFKFRNSYALWVIIGVITASCCISIATGSYSSAEQTLLHVTKDSMVPLLACAIYSAIVLTDDFSSGILRHYIASGYKRRAIILAKCMHYFFGCMILLLVYPGFCVMLTAMWQGTETSFSLVLRDMFSAFIQTLPLYAGILGLFFLFSVLIQKGVMAVGVSVTTAVLLVVFTNKFYTGAVSVLKYSPIIQIGEVAGGTISGAYFLSALLSLAILSVCVLGGIRKFSREEF